MTRTKAHDRQPEQTPLKTKEYYGLPRFSTANRHSWMNLGTGSPSRSHKAASGVPNTSVTITKCQ